MEEILASIRRIIADDEALPVVRREKEKKEPPRLMAETPRVSETAPARSESADRGPLEEGQNRAPAVVVPVRLPLPQSAESRPALPSPQDLQPQDFWLRPTHRPEPEHARAEPASSEPTQWRQEHELDDAYEAEESETPASAYVESDERVEDDVFEEPAEDSADEDDGPRQPLVSADAAANVASHFQALAASMVINEADVIERYAQDILRPMLKQWLDDNLPTLVERLVRAEIERVARGRR